MRKYYPKTGATETEDEDILEDEQEGHMSLDRVRAVKVKRLELEVRQYREEAQVLREGVSSLNKRLQDTAKNHQDILNTERFEWEVRNSDLRRRNQSEVKNLTKNLDDALAQVN